MKCSTIIRLYTIESCLQFCLSESYMKATQPGPLPFPGWPRTDRAHKISPREKEFMTEACLKFSGIYTYEKGSRINTPAMVSFPGSGNTWLRYLLNMMTGIYSDSIYNEYVRLGKFI